MYLFNPLTYVDSVYE